MKITIIGAGLGGLSCGIHLALKGHEVRVLEQNDRPGGRANRVEEKGFKIDMGPTLVLMPEVLRSVFTAAGENIDDYLKLTRLDPGYLIHFPDKDSIAMRSSPEAMRQEIVSRPGQREASFDRYLADVRAKFESSRGTFIERNFNSVAEMINLEALASFIRIKPWGNAYDHAFGFFGDAKIAAALSCQCLYLGQSPAKTPSLYNLLAYAEFTHGIWYPQGGMHEVARALEKVLVKKGGKIQYGASVKRIRIANGRATGVVLKDGSEMASDAVVSNRDLPSSYTDLVDSSARPALTDRKIRDWHYGSSCLLFYLGLNRRIPNLTHHAMFLSRDFKASLAEIFDAHRLPQDPLLYVCAPTQTDTTIAPPGGEIVYILAIVPNLATPVHWPTVMPEFRARVWDRLARSGIEIRDADIALERVFYPEDFKKKYGSFLGTAFGLAPDFFQSAAFRPAIVSPHVRDLYHVGASTHPGGGVPMVLTSGRLCAEEIHARAAKAAVQPEKRS